MILHTSGFPNLSLILACGQTSSCVQFSSVAQSCLDSATPRSAARQASLSITNSQSLLKFMSIELVMPSNHLILCRCGERALPLAKVLRKEAWHTQRRDRASGVSLENSRASTPKTRVCLLSALCFHLHL